MNASSSRRPGQGVRNVVRFNWDFYALGGAVVLVGGAVLAVWGHRLPGLLRGVGALGVAVGAYFLVASLLVSWWVYDVAPLYCWRWLPAWLGRPAPAAALNITAGFDESTAPLRAAFPATRWHTADFYDALPQREPSIVRARRHYPPAPTAQPATPTHLPFAEAEFDLVCVLFAAHEIRDAAQRLAFFREVRRVLAPGGQAVLVEHVRDAANALAFGPGVGHFFAVADWEQAATGAGLRISRRHRHTPFVRAWLLTRPT